MTRAGDQWCGRWMLAQCLGSTQEKAVSTRSRATGNLRECRPVGWDLMASLGVLTCERRLCPLGEDGKNTDMHLVMSAEGRIHGFTCFLSLRNRGVW